MAKQYYYIKALADRPSAPRFHANRQCLFAARLAGHDVIPYTHPDVNEWVRTAKCAACGLPLNQPATSEAANG